MVAIHAVWHNFPRLHKTLRISPAIAAGVCDTLMSWERIVEAMDADAA